MEKREFNIAFQLSKLILFNVSYYTLGSNPTPHFSTSADKFYSNKHDFCRGGQAQDDLTKGFPAARAFWQKWDKHHLHDLTQDQYNEMIDDLKVLMDKYNFVEYDDNHYIPFSKLVRLSELTPKSKFKTLEKWQQYMEEQKAGSILSDDIHTINIW